VSVNNDDVFAIKKKVVDVYKQCNWSPL